MHVDSRAHVSKSEMMFQVHATHSNTANERNDARCVAMYRFASHREKPISSFG